MASTLSTVNKDLEQQQDITQNEIVDSSRNIKRIAIETTDTAKATMVNLEQQREKLEEADKHMDNIDIQTRQAQQGLDDLDKCCGLCICPWNRYKAPKKKSTKTEKRGHDNDISLDCGPAPVTMQPKAQETDVKMKVIMKGDSRETEIQENIQYAATAVDNLHQMALDMGTEIQSQNVLLKNVDKKAKKNNQAIENANEHAAKQLM